MQRDSHRPLSHPSSALQRHLITLLAQVSVFLISLFFGGSSNVTSLALGNIDTYSGGIELALIQLQSVN